MHTLVCSLYSSTSLSGLPDLTCYCMDNHTNDKQTIHQRFKELHIWVQQT
eukprot:m.1236 g.1236  ORF g.1236 m.1236 type:complete len:50 (+) comp739_c0_seq1:218-367(+)